MNVPPPAPRWLRSLLVSLFFLSGACGLIYQVLWLRLLGLVFGVTVYAASTVWASFMGGLALGSFAGGRLGDRVRRPLVWFGIAEALVGLSVLMTPAALATLQTLYLPLQASLRDSAVLLTLARLAISFAVLVVPTMMMGASLPLIVKGVMTSGAAVGGRAGALYAANTAGAILGTLVAGLVFIPALGIDRTFSIAAGANLFVGIVAIAVGLGLDSEPRAASREPRASSPEPPGMAPQRVRRLVLALFFFSGLTSLALEVIWFRMIVLIVRPTVYAFSFMLAAVLAGIALGSAIVAPFIRERSARDWPFILAVVQVLTGAAALVSLSLLNQTATLQQWFGPIVNRIAPDYLTYTIVTAVPAVLPASILLGIAFPIGLHIWAGATDDGAPVASRVGMFYSLNVAGAILGSLAAGFVLLPAFGSRVSLVLVAAVMFAGGLALFLMLGPAPSERQRVEVSRLAIAGALAIAFAVAASRIDDPFEAFLKVRYPADTVVWHDESVQTTVSIHRQPGGGLSMQLEGNHQASDQASMAFVHHRIGYLPMAVHPDPKDALVIGLGGGATAGAVAIDSGVNVTVVELSRAVVRGAEYFTHINFNVLTRPNVRLLVDDGRNYLLTTEKKFDVVTADIVLPIHAGANNLYSAEYFQLVKRVLKPGGIFVQWVAGTEAEYQVITRTFLSVFPMATAWIDGGLLLGGPDGLVLSRAAFERKQATPSRLPTLAAMRIEKFEDLLALFRAGAGELRQFIGPGPILTDDRPLVEYFLSLPRDRDPDLSRLRGDAGRYIR
jgi:spermidine synthase